MSLPAACEIAVRGDYDGVPFSPNQSAFVFADRHDILVVDGAGVPVLRPESQRTLTVLLTDAYIDENAEWRAYAGPRLSDLKSALAVRDGLLLRGLSLDALGKGTKQRAVHGAEGASGDFEFAVVAARPNEDQLGDAGFGSRVTVTVTPNDVQLGERGRGSVSLTIEVKRDREAGQAGEVATGVVDVDVNTSFSPERLGKANVAVAAPVLVCAARAGPHAAPACRDVEAERVVDATGDALGAR